MSSMLVFSSVGTVHPHEYKRAVFSSWKMGGRDSVCTRYRPDDQFEYGRYFEVVVEMQGHKFTNFFRLAEEFGLARQYSHFAVMDDDLLLTGDDPLKRMADDMERLGLDIASPSNGCGGMKSFHSIMNCSEAVGEVCVTDFCEMGAMILSSRMLESAIIAHRLEGYEGLRDYGMDMFLCNLANKMGYEIGIFRNVLYHNPNRIPENKRDTQRKSWESLVGMELTTPVSKKILKKISLEQM